MKKVLAALVAFALFALFPSSSARAAEDEKIDLALRLPEGTAHRMKLTTELEIVQSPMGQKQQTTMAATFGVLLEVENVEADGTMQLKWTYKTAVLEQEGPGGEFKYDSANPPEHLPPGARATALMLGQSFTMKMTPTGHVTELKGLDAVFERIVEDSDLPEEMKAQFLQDLKKQFGDEALSQMMKQMLGPFPGKPVAVGDTWTDEAPAKTAVPIKVETTWTLKARENGKAIVHGESKVESDEEAEPTRLGSVSVRYRLSGTQQVIFELDELTGWTHKATFVQNLSGTVAMNLPDMEEEMVVPMTIKTTAQIETEQAN